MQKLGYKVIVCFQILNDIFIGVVTAISRELTPVLSIGQGQNEIIV